jgi:hypothetical protein
MMMMMMMMTMMTMMMMMMMMMVMMMMMMMMMMVIITITTSHLTSPPPRYPIGYESDSVWLTHTVSNSSDPMSASSFTTSIFHSSCNVEPDITSARFTNSSRRPSISNECLFLHHRVMFPALFHRMAPG